MTSSYIYPMQEISARSSKSPSEVLQAPVKAKTALSACVKPQTLCRVLLHLKPLISRRVASALIRPLSSLSEPVFSLGKCRYAPVDLCFYARCDLIRKRSGIPIFVPTAHTLSTAHDVSIWRSSESPPSSRSML
jgi:hypothetical protein|eukprot:2565970-Prymnesium_polylepis.1